MFNFLAFVLCTIASMSAFVHNDYVFGIIEFILALVNLPFVIRWLENFSNK
jgi:hypothetical protein